jgi:hypothetical protein
LIFLRSLSSMFSLCYTSTYIRYGRQCFCEYKSDAQAIMHQAPAAKHARPKSLSHLDLLDLKSQTSQGLTRIVGGGGDY